MLNEKLFEYNEISLDELIKSQDGNLTTKKERQKSRFTLYKFLGYRLPSFDGGFNNKKLNLALELFVYTSQKVFYGLEKIKLYLKIAKLIKRV